MADLAGTRLTADAFERFLAENRAKLHRYCARMTGSVIDGEDVLQDAMLKAVSRPDDPLSATELSQVTPHEPTLRDRFVNKLAFVRGLGGFGGRNDAKQMVVTRDMSMQREIENGR